MIEQIIPLFNYENGVVMIAVVGLVFILLAVMLIVFMNSGKKKKN